MPKRNRLFGSLPPDVQADLSQQSRIVALERGKVLHHAGEDLRYVYFPITCLISVTIHLQEGKTIETGAMGSHEVLGVNALMGGCETTHTEYIVQVPGEALKVPAKPLFNAFEADARVRHIFLNYTQAMIAQVSQNTACIRAHSHEQRYARWLLCVRDRVQGDTLHLTQEFMGEALGMRRATICETANEFNDRGLITLTRGGLKIENAEGLKKISCECYEVLQHEYDRLLGAHQGPEATAHPGAQPENPRLNRGFIM
jgi:CRP-like cAMP-binding protein